RNRGADLVDVSVLLLRHRSSVLWDLRGGRLRPLCSRLLERPQLGRRVDPTSLTIERIGGQQWHAACLPGMQRVPIRLDAVRPQLAESIEHARTIGSFAGRILQRGNNLGARSPL